METKYMAGDTDLKPNTFTYNAVSEALAFFLRFLWSLHLLTYSLLPFVGYQRSSEK